MSNQHCSSLDTSDTSPNLGRGHRIAPALLILSCTLIGAAACQKAEETESQSEVQVTKITPDTQAESEKETTDTANNEVPTEASAETNDLQAQTSDTPEDSDILLTNADIPAVPDDTVDNLDTPSPSADESKAMLEKQVTDVEYRSASGQSLKVTFQTSALETLEADVMLPSGKKVMLTAPKGQGNNPTYRSKDGSIELVTHGGGGSIDLLYDGQLASFDAVSADAEVISPP